MTYFETLDKTKKKKIIEMFSEFGIEKLPYLLIKTGSEKIRGYSGSLSVEEINKLKREINIEAIGMKLFTINGNEARINFDAVSMPEIKKQVKNKEKIIEINNEQLKAWFHGENIEINNEQMKAKDGFVILKHGEDFVGMGKKIKNLVLNYVPKERRVRN